MFIIIYKWDLEYNYEDYDDNFDDIERETLDKDYDDNDEKDFSENSVYDRLQDSTYNKSDIDFLMENDDLRDDFFWFFYQIRYQIFYQIRSQIQQKCRSVHEPGPAR